MVDGIAQMVLMKLLVTELIGPVCLDVIIRQFTLLCKASLTDSRIACMEMMSSFNLFGLKRIAFMHIFFNRMVNSDTRKYMTLDE